MPRRFRLSSQRNFVVTGTDGWTLNDSRERKVTVKLSDFRLSTRDVVSSEKNCGSPRYMSYGVLFWLRPFALPTRYLDVVLRRVQEQCAPRL